MKSPFSSTFVISRQFSTFPFTLLCDVIILWHQNVVDGVNDPVVGNQVRGDSSRSEDVSPPSKHDVIAFGTQVEVLTVDCLHFVGPLHQRIEAVVS